MSLPVRESKEQGQLCQVTNFAVRMKREGKTAKEPYTRESTILVRRKKARPQRIELTWLVQTLLNVTKAKVCASIQVARSRLANTIGMSIALRPSCGINARDSSCRVDWAAGEELRYKSVLYGEKLWRWSILVRWWRILCCKNGKPYLQVDQQRTSHRRHHYIQIIHYDTRD